MSLYECFLEVGCVKKRGIGPTGQAALSFDLFADYDLRIYSQKSDWKRRLDIGSGINFYVYSPRYEQVMASMVNVKPHLLDYFARQYDGEGGSGGCLYMSHPIVELVKEKTSFSNGGITYTLEELFNRISEIGDPENLFTSVYCESDETEFRESKIARFFSSGFERIWVYLYLACEAGLDCIQIFEHMRSESMIQNICTWQLVKPYSMELVLGFKEVYDTQ